MLLAQPSIQAFRAYHGNRPFIASHKGRNSGFVAESTLRSFQLAIAEGADFIETDVSMTRDGNLILMHGPNLDRYTNSTGPIIEKSLDEIQHLQNRTCNGLLGHCQILTLPQFLGIFKDKCLINLDRCFDFLPEAYRHISHLGMEDQVLLKSGKNLEDSFHWIEKQGFRPQFMPIVKNDEATLQYILDTAAFYPYPAVELVFTNDDHPIIQKSAIDKLHGLGIKVWINSLTLSFPLCGGHDDICSLFDNPDNGWGWLYRHGADVIQTDFVRETLDYFNQ